MESRSVMGVEIILMDLRKKKLSPDLLSLRASFLFAPNQSQPPLRPCGQALFRELRILPEFSGMFAAWPIS